MGNKHWGFWVGFFISYLLITSNVFAQRFPQIPKNNPSDRFRIRQGQNSIHIDQCRLMKRIVVTPHKENPTGRMYPNDGNWNHLLRVKIAAYGGQIEVTEISGFLTGYGPNDTVHDLVPDENANPYPFSSISMTNGDDDIRLRNNVIIGGEAFGGRVDNEGRFVLQLAEGELMLQDSCNALQTKTAILEGGLYIPDHDWRPRFRTCISRVVGRDTATGFQVTFTPEEPICGNELSLHGCGWGGHVCPDYHPDGGW